MIVIKFFLAVLAIITIFIVLLIIYSKIVRLFKKKSYHYIVPPEPGKDKNWYPIEISKYKCFIFIENSSEEFIIENLASFLDTEKRETGPNAIKIDITKQNDWFLLKVGNASFVDFKTLVWVLDDYSEINKSLARVIGYCIHKSIPLEDYIFKIDKDLEEENFIGSFRNGKNFGIYLPNSGFHESGNISLSRNNELNFYSEESQLPLELLEMKMVPVEELIKYYR